MAGRLGNNLSADSFPTIPDTTDHLLKVAQSVAHDANDTWTQIWCEYKKYVTPSGIVMPEMEKGFVPACGWPEFLERFWLLKHYLDSIERICAKQH